MGLGEVYCGLDPDMNVGARERGRSVVNDAVRPARSTNIAWYVRQRIKMADDGLVADEVERLALRSIQMEPFQGSIGCCGCVPTVRGEAPRTLGSPRRLWATSKLNAVGGGVFRVGGGCAAF